MKIYKKELKMIESKLNEKNEKTLVNGKYYPTWQQFVA
jgi:hypothetical protein